MQAVKLNMKDKSNFHFGKGVNGIKDSLSSDQLFSALINNYAKLYPEKVNDIISDFMENKLILSSLFYGIDFISKKKKLNDKRIYFLPKPDIGFLTDESTILKSKNLKKARYFSVNLINDIAGKWNPRNSSVELSDLKIRVLGSRFVITECEYQDMTLGQKDLKDFKIFNTNSRPRVRVDRWLDDESGDHFYQENLVINHFDLRMYLAKPFHYFIIKGELNSYTKAAINLMSEDGLGGKRSIGSGLYENVSYNNIPINTSRGNYMMSLSSIYPAEDELDFLYNYSLEKREGYIFSSRGRSIKKPLLRILKEGSIFSGEIEGKVIEITPKSFKENHSVYFNGKALLFNFGGE